MRRLLLGTAFVVVMGLIALLLASALGIFPAQDRAITEVSLEAAESAEGKLERMSSNHEEVRLTAVELTSLFHYRPEVWSLGPLLSPNVAMNADTLTLTGRVPTSSLSSGSILDRVRPFLPDTADVMVSGAVVSPDQDRAVLYVRNVEVAGMPVPSRYIMEAISHLDRASAVGTAEPALELPLPVGITSARVEAGELILTP
jgi:hypothetical protein